MLALAFVGLPDVGSPRTAADPHASFVGGTAWTMLRVKGPPVAAAPFEATRPRDVVPAVSDTRTLDWVPVPQPAESSLQPEAREATSAQVVNTSSTVSWVVPAQ